MGVIEPLDRTVKTLTGLHVYHAGRSNCSARVRLLIEEKGLPWISHYVDIHGRENITEAYFAINPKGLVPTLVHDGRVVVESNDILLYLEEKFPTPSFTPNSRGRREAMLRWVKRSADMHVPAVKTYMYAKVNAALLAKTPDEIARYCQLQKDPEMLAFHAKHDGGASFPKEDVERALAALRQTMAELNAILGSADWIAGEYSLADISWAPSMTTLLRSDFPFNEFPNVERWYARISARDAFKRAVKDWYAEPRKGVIGMNGAVAA